MTVESRPKPDPFFFGLLVGAWLMLMAVSAGSYWLQAIHDVGMDQRVCMKTRDDDQAEVRQCVSSEQLLDYLRQQQR